jgi:protease-4
MSTTPRISFWKIFWPTLIAVFVAITIWFLVSLGILGGIVASLSSSEDNDIEEKTVLHMTLSGSIGENGKSKFEPSTFEVSHKYGLSDILYGLNKAKSDKSIQGIYIELNGLDCGITTAREIRNAIKDFQKSGKFVIAYNAGEVITQKQLYITSAVSNNYGFPSTNVEFLGLSASPVFFKNALDKLGIQMQVIRGKSNDFKSAVEPFLYTQMSDSSKLQTQVLLTNIWNTLLKDMSNDLSIKTKTLNTYASDATITSVEDAVRKKMMKAALYKDEVLEKIAKEITCDDIEDIPFFSFEKYATKEFYANQSLEKIKKPNIAVILAEGDISTSGEGLSSDNVANYIREARLDKNIQTIVLRVNSPGGSALASDIIWREVELANKSKKVVVSMGDLAASGGYFISAPASYIFAEPTTITGSIGVFGVIPYTGDFFNDKLGVSFDYVKTNKHSSLSLNKKLSTEEIELIQKEVDKIYTSFISKVASGRKLSTQAVHKIARGRVWTGNDALKIGLVDQIGGINDAIAYAANQAKIKTVKLRYWPEKKMDPFEEVFEKLDELKEDEKSSSKVKIPFHIEKYWEQLNQLEQIKGIQMRMPYEFSIQ